MSLNEKKEDLTSQFQKMYYNSNDREFVNNFSNTLCEEEKNSFLSSQPLLNSSKLNTVCNLNLDNKDNKNSFKIKNNSTSINKSILDQNKYKVKNKIQNPLTETRIRYISGDASLSSVYRSTYIPQNRPRSNSEGKVKKTNAIMSTIKKSVHLPWTGQINSKHSYNNHQNSFLITPNTNELKNLIKNVSNNDDKARIRSSSGSSTNNNSTINKMIERFRNRSLSMDYANPKKKEDGDGNDSLLRRHSIDPEVRKNRTFSHKCVDGFDLQQNHFSFYRDHRTSRSNSCKPYTSIESINERLDFEDLEKDRSLIYLKFFQFYHCYDLIPISSKLIVFDTQLLVKKAFYALLNHGLRAAPLWDSNKQMFVGMLTITYFINILIKFYTSSKIEMNKLEEQKLETWKNLLEDKRTLITIDPESSVLDAIKTLVKNKIHRLPIVDPETNNVIYILTHKRILKFFYLYCSYLPKPSFIDWTIEELKLGTYSNIEITTMSAKLINVMQKFVERRVSALPVVDKNNKLIDVYSKFDLFNLAAEKMYDNLEITIEKTLNNRQHWFEDVVKCTLEDKFINVLERIVKAEVHRIVVVDSENYVVGIISLSDILQCLTSRHKELILSKELISQENENLVYRYNNNNNIIKNQNHFEEKELEGNYRAELHKIDEI